MPLVSRPLQRASHVPSASGWSSTRSASEFARATSSPAAPRPAGRISTPLRAPSSAGTSIVGELPAGTTPPASGFDGHHARSPSSEVIAGTIVLRTRNVSISTPSATVKPSSNSSHTGSVVSTMNVPARIRPALVITGPVETIPRRIPSCVPRSAASSRTRLIRKML